MINLDYKIQLDIFEKIFLDLLESPSVRWELKKMIEHYDKVDFAEVDFKLKKLSAELR